MPVLVAQPQSNKTALKEYRGQRSCRLDSPSKTNMNPPAKAHKSDEWAT